MRKITVSILISILMLLSYGGAANAMKDKVNIAVQFKCNFLSKYMAKHGYVFVETSNKKNIFAARDAKVTIKDMNDKVLGVGKTDKNGAFSRYITVNEEYKVVVEFHGHETVFEVPSSKLESFTAYLGYFETDEVGGWIDTRLNLR